MSVEKEKMEKMPDNEKKERKSKKKKSKKTTSKKRKGIGKVVFLDGQSPLRTKQILGMKHGTGMNRDIPVMGGGSGSPNLMASLARQVGVAGGANVPTPDQMRLQQDISQIKEQQRIADQGIHVVEGEVVTPTELKQAQAELVAEAVKRNRGRPKGALNKSTIAKQQAEADALAGKPPTSIGKMKPPLYPPPPYPPRSTEGNSGKAKLDLLASTYVIRLNSGEAPTDEGEDLAQEYKKLGFHVPTELARTLETASNASSSLPDGLYQSPLRNVNLNPNSQMPKSRGIQMNQNKINATSYADLSTSLVGSQAFPTQVTHAEEDT